MTHCVRKSQMIRLKELLLVNLMALSSLTMGNGANRGGTDGTYLSQAQTIQKIAQARNLAKAVLITVESSDVIFSIPEAAEIYTDANRFAVLADLTRKDPVTKDFLSRVVAAKAEDVYVIAAGKRINKLAVTELKTPSNTLIREDLLASASVELLAQVITHEFFHHLEIDDKLVELDGEMKNQLDVLAVDLFAHYNQVKTKDKQTIKERINELENSLKAMQLKLLGDTQVAGGKLSFNQPNGEDDIGQSGQELQLEAIHLKKFFVKSNAFMSFLGLGHDTLDTTKIKATAKNFYCTSKGFLELRVFQKLLTLSGINGETFRGKQSVILISDLIEEYNRRLLESCPKTIIDRCAPYTGMGFTEKPGHLGHVVYLQGPIVAMGMSVKWEYTGPDSLDANYYDYTYDTQKMIKAQQCFIQYLSQK